MRRLIRVAYILSINYVIVNCYILPIIIPKSNWLQKRNQIRILRRFSIDSSKTKNGYAFTGTSNTSGTVFSCASLIAGTTIGGGFLALPYVTFPLGFLPSVIGLSLSWAYLTSCALSLSNATVIVMQQQNSTENISVFKIAKLTYGNLAGAVTATLFVILMLATLVAQLSKIGTLVPTLFGSIFTKDTAILSFVSIMSLVTFGYGIEFAERINNILTAAMITSFGLIVLSAHVGGFDWTRLISRGNYCSLLPYSFKTSQQGNYVSWAIPVFLQLLVYSETIPLVVSRLNGDEKKAKLAIISGSLIPLLMCIVWSGVAIGLIPFDSTAFVHGSIETDPVDILLKNSQPARIKYSILFLTFSAISTTVIGSCLTIDQFLTDVTKENNIISKVLSIVPAGLIASVGPKSLYYACTQFAGAFPVTLLWGLYPLLAKLKLTLQTNRKSNVYSNLRDYILILISVAMIVVNVKK